MALVGDVYCIFVTFPFGILGQVWNLIVLFPDLCHLSYFIIVKHVVLLAINIIFKLYCVYTCLRTTNDITKVNGDEDKIGLILIFVIEPTIWKLIS